MFQTLLLALLPLFFVQAFTPALASDGGSSKGKTRGVLGPILISPTLTLIGAPNPFRVGLETKAWSTAGLSFDYGFLPELSFSGAKIKYNSWRITGRIYPFGGALFLGLGFGKQNLTGSSSNTITAVISDFQVSHKVNYTVEVNTTILVPHIGWRWVADGGFFFGMEYGLQLASSSTSIFTSNAPAAILAVDSYLTEKANIEEQARKLGRTTLPHFALIQFGFFF